MREETIKIYTINELSETARQTAYEKWLSGQDYFFWGDENKNSLDAFLEIFDITVSDWKVSSCYYDFNFSSNYDDDINSLSGIRLMKWLWNNHKTDIYKPKYLSKNGVGSKNYISGHSKIQIESSCPMTGYCMDNSLFYPILQFFNKPEKHITLEDLLRDCIDSFFADYQKDMEYSESMEAFKEDCEGNEIEFTEDGSRY